MHGAARLRTRATAIGVVAIVLWASLALFTTLAGGIPPFQLLALSFAVAFCLGVLVLACSRRPVLATLRQPLLPWLAASTAIFTYHALYFCALSWAPPAHASLLAYLWPLLIVILSGIGREQGRREWIACLAGAMLGFAGTVAIVGSSHEAAPAPFPAAGYAAAIGCALVWSTYSVANRRFSDVPTGMLVGVCGAVAAAGFLVHVAAEAWVAPSPPQWLAIVALGAGPTGLAFFAWDHATKHGHLSYLGLLSYLAPLLSTALLVIAGEEVATRQLVIAALLIVAGALLPRLVQSGTTTIDR